MEINSIKIGNFLASQAPNGDWVYKSDKKIISPFKKNNSAYKDLPRFKIIVDYENQEVQDFNALLEQSVKEISHKLLSFSQSINHL